MSKETKATLNQIAKPQNVKVNTLPRSIVCDLGGGVRPNSLAFDIIFGLFES